MHREKTFLVSGRVNLVIGNNLDATPAERRRKPDADLPHRKDVLQVTVAMTAQAGQTGDGLENRRTET
jgi:hypothetical protein